MIDVLERTDSESITDNSEDNKFAHYAEKASVTEGYVMGTTVVALCGKLFIPSRDPEKLPICIECKEILDFLFSGSE